MEERYNSSSGQIRTLASAWLLGALGATGWMFSAYDPETWPLPIGLLIVVVMTLGSFGIITLWVMDQLVFHRLLTSVFLVGLKMEKDDHQIPPLRSMMMKFQEGLGTHRWERIFYLSPALAFLLITFTIIIGGSERLFSPNISFITINMKLLSLGLGMSQLAAIVWMITKLPSMSLENRASHFEDEEFTALVSKRRYEMTISKFISNTDTK